jgi:hypothetical protein
MSKDYSEYRDRQLTVLMLELLERIADALTVDAVVEPAPAAQGTDVDLCPSRYPLADGREAPCMWHDSITHPDRCSTGTAPLMQWDRLDPLARDATCTACGGKGVMPSGANRSANPVFAESPCIPCDGTGVDEAVPMHFVGVGSTLLDSTDGTEHVVTARAGAIIFMRSIQDGKWSNRVEDEVGPGKERSVLRVVRPAHSSIGES